MSLRALALILATLPILLLFDCSILVAQNGFALSGSPLGIGYIETNWATSADSSQSVLITEGRGRVFYPAVSPKSVTIPGKMRIDPASRELKFGKGRIIERLGQVVKAAVTADSREEIVGHGVWFIFRGTEPLELTLHGPQKVSVILTPEPSVPEYLDAAKLNWWQAFQANAKKRIENPSIPPTVDAQLLSMLSRRLSLPESDSLSRMRLQNLPSALQLALDPTRVQQISLGRTLQRSHPQPPLYEFPEDSSDAHANIEPLADNTTVEGIEDIARYVPPECFYLRFGSFNNFLWFQKLAKEHGGDVMRMAALPSLDYRTGPRVEELLNVKYTKLADLFGDKLIADVAVVGNDLHMKEGPSIGVLLRARNAFLLSTFMDQDRKSTASTVAECKLESIKIRGIDTSFLSTPDNRIRSFWIKNGDWFFVTSSRRLAERFVEARKERKTLAATSQFQEYRKRYPSDPRSPEITAFLSTRFLTSLLSPQYQIGLARRSRSLAEMACATTAQFCAESEGYTSYRLHELKQNGFLPEHFGERPDGSTLVANAAGEYVDSLLGIRESMLPITDMSIDKISSDERLWLELVERSKRDRPGQLEPLFAQIAHTNESSAASDQLKITLNFSPALLGKHAWLANELGSPRDIGVKHPPSDLVKFSANIESQRFDLASHVLFGGVKDCSPIPFEQFDTTLDKLFGIPSVEGYLGAWPDPGLIDRLPLGLGRGTRIGPNTTRLVGGAYRFQSEKVSLLSFQREILNESIPSLAITSGQPNASARVSIADLTSTALGAWVNQTLLIEPRKQSAAARRHLDQLSQQLRVPREKAAAAAKSLHGAEIMCAIGGKMELREDGRWHSNAENLQEALNSPVMQWFRGAELEIDRESERLEARINVRVQRRGEQESRALVTPESEKNISPQKRASF